MIGQMLKIGPIVLKLSPSRRVTKDEMQSARVKTQLKDILWEKLFDVISSDIIAFVKRFNVANAFIFFLGNDDNGIVTVFILVLVANVAVTARPRYFYLRLSQSCSVRLSFTARGTQSKIVLHV